MKIVKVLSFEYFVLYGILHAHGSMAAYNSIGINT